MLSHATAADSRGMEHSSWNMKYDILASYGTLYGVEFLFIYMSSVVRVIRG